MLVESDAITIATVKTLIKNKEGIPRNQQRLMFGHGLTLDDENTLAFYLIADGDTIELVLLKSWKSVLLIG